MEDVVSELEGSDVSFTLLAEDIHVKFKESWSYLNGEGKVDVPADFFEKAHVHG